MLIRFILLISLLAGLNSMGFSQKDSLVHNKDSFYWMRYEEYNPYSWLNMASIPIRVTMARTNCVETFEYSYQGVTGHKSNRIILIFNRCDHSLSRYESKIDFPDPFFPETPEYSANLEFMDSLDCFYLGKTYTIKKYRAEVVKGGYVTLYYNELIGIIKQYGSYRSISQDNIEIEYVRLKNPQKNIVNALLNAIGNNEAFHERYDFGPRIIQREIIDKKKFRKTKRLYKKRGYI